MITQKDGEIVFPVADGSATLSGRDYEFQGPTLRRESTVRRKNLRGESHGDREEFRLEESEDDAEARKGFGLIMIEPRVQLTCREKNHSLFFKKFLLNETPPRRNIRCGERIGKAKTSAANTNSIVFDIAGKGRNSVLY